MSTRSTMVRCSVLAIALLGLPVVLHAAEPLVWLEAEQFRSPGGWTPDAQFVDQMGSPYLLAIGLGTPVADATTVCRLPRAGQYRLWVRTRDWAPEHHPGRFQVLLAGRAVPKEFGVSGEKGWRWEDGGVHTLPAEVEIRLHDCTGYYARCDALALAADLAWTPPGERPAIQSLREAHGGVSPAITAAGPYDVVVVGGGLAGCLAAVAAARQGAHTLLVQNRPVLGGNASVEILVPPVGVWPHSKMDPLDPRETGLIEEMRTAGNQKTDEAKLYSARLLRFVQAEPRVELRLNTHITGVDMQSPGKIAAVLGFDVRTGKRYRFPGKIFVDCSGECAVGVPAGAEFRHGREPRSMYNESLAIEQADRQTMGNSLKYVSLPTGAPQPFTAVPWAYQFPKCEDLPPGRHPLLGTNIEWQWKLELGGTRDTFADAEEIRDDVLRLIFGLWDHVKNHCPQLHDKAADHRLAWVAHVAGKRENRRLIGDYVLTENDIRQQTVFPDRIAYCGWGIDDHYPEGFFYNGPPAKHGLHAIVHGIPYRSLYSKNVENLLMAGRNISASHLAMAATRVMITCGIIGHAAGTAAGLSIRHDATPREVGQRYLTDLQQQLLKDGAYLIDLPNRDPADLARTAQAQASSFCTLPSGEKMEAARVLDGFARAEHGQTHAWSPDPQQPLPQSLTLRWPTEQTFNMVHVAFQTKERAASRFAVEVERNGRWQSVAEVQENHQRHHMLGFPLTTAAAVRVTLLERGKQAPGICEIRVYRETDDALATAARAARTRDLPDPPPALGWDDSRAAPPGVDPRKLPGIVIDDTQAELEGHWATSNHALPYVLQGYAHDGNADKGSSRATFRVKVPQAGRYEVRFAYLALPNRARRVPITIQSADGEKTVTVDERERPSIDGLWRSLGVFRFLAGSEATIVVTNAGTDNYVSVDAVQLLPVDK